MPEFHDSAILVKRLLRCLDDGASRRVTILTGAPLTMPVDGSPGVPPVAGMIDLVREALGRDARLVDDTCHLLPPSEAYQSAFAILQAVAGQDKVNEVIRRAVLSALQEHVTVPPRVDELWCEHIQQQRDHWHLSPGVDALGSILARYPSSFGEIALTTNFDPLLEAAIEHHHGRSISTALHSDGSWAFTFGRACHVVHLHGFWLGTDTLHTPQALSQPRPQLASSLRRLISGSTLLVFAYSGWADIVMTTLAELIQDQGAFPDVLWTFYEDDATKIVNGRADLLRRLNSGRPRITYFKGIDVHKFLPQLAAELKNRKPAENLNLFLELTQREFELRGRGSPRLGDDPSIGEWVKHLKAFGDHLPAQAAIAAADYVLPIFSGSSRESAPWRAIQAAKACLADTTLALDCLECAGIAQLEARTCSNKPASDACLSAAQAGFAAAGFRGQDSGLPSHIEAAKGVHCAFRSARDDALAVWNRIHGDLRSK